MQPRRVRAWSKMAYCSRTNDFVRAKIQIAMPSNFHLAIHGGAGDITPTNLPPDEEAEARDDLTEVLRAGYDLLKRGGSSLDAVELAVSMLEDAPHFNAARGATFNSEGKNELDAAIMCGRTQNAGAVAGVTVVRNPVRAARAVMESSPYVLLIGPGADAFARKQNLEIVAPEYFSTPRQRARFERMQSVNPIPASEKFGTVGAVALDGRGDLAAATSTGGMLNKTDGRVGDSPIIGAGTYASNATCAISCTGHGEHFIRSVAAYDVAALMEYRGLSLQFAVDEVVMRKLKARGGEGGMIALDAAGNCALLFNSAGMYRGQIGVDGNADVAIFG